MGMQPEQAVSDFKKDRNCSPAVISVYAVSGFFAPSHKT